MSGCLPLFGHSLAQMSFDSSANTQHHSVIRQPNRTLTRRRWASFRGEQRSPVVFARRNGQIPPNGFLGQLFQILMEWHPARLEDSHPNSGLSALAAIAGPQSAMQRAIYGGMVRTYDVLINHRRDGMPTKEEWRQHLGIELREFMLVTWCIGAAAISSRGVVSPPEIASILSERLEASRDEIEASINEHLLATWNELQTLATAVPVDAGYEEWAFNPLWAKPLLDIDGAVPCRFVTQRNETPLKYHRSETPSG